jgi:DNA-directed RNA polymerase subunit K/omega
MTSEISADKVVEQVPNRYLLTVVVAKRAAQIRDELNKLGPLASNSPHPITMALQDVCRANVKAIAIEPAAASEEQLDPEALKDLKAAMELSADESEPEEEFDPAMLLEPGGGETATAGIETGSE